MEKKEFKFVNLYDKNKIVFHGAIIFDFMQHTTLVKIYCDNVFMDIKYIEIEIFENNQCMKNVFEIPVIGKNISIVVEANYNLEMINIGLLKD